MFVNNSTITDVEEIHPSDLSSDLLSLYDRFGIHIHLYQNSQIEYLELVKKLLVTYLKLTLIKKLKEWL